MFSYIHTIDPRFSKSFQGKFLARKQYAPGRLFREIRYLLSRRVVLKLRIVLKFTQAEERLMQARMPAKPAAKPAQRLAVSKLINSLIIWNILSGPIIPIQSVWSQIYSSCPILCHSLFIYKNIVPSCTHKFGGAPPYEPLQSSCQNSSTIYVKIKLKFQVDVKMQKFM